MRIEAPHFGATLFLAFFLTALPAARAQVSYIAKLPEDPLKDIIIEPLEHEILMTPVSAYETIDNLISGNGSSEDETARPEIVLQSDGHTPRMNDSEDLKSVIEKSRWQFQEDRLNDIIPEKTVFRSDDTDYEALLKEHKWEFQFKGFKELVEDQN